MKCTPQNTMTSASRLRGFARQAERVADEIGDVLDLGPLVVVREDDGVALLRERLDAIVGAGDHGSIWRSGRRSMAGEIDMAGI